MKNIKYILAALVLATFCVSSFADNSCRTGKTTVITLKDNLVVTGIKGSQKYTDDAGQNIVFCGNSFHAVLSIQDGIKKSTYKIHRSGNDLHADYKKGEFLHASIVPGKKGYYSKDEGEINFSKN